MPIPRIYYSENLALNTVVSLSPQASKHLISVLRLQISESVILFNGQGGEYAGQLLEINKTRGVLEASIEIQEYRSINRESPLTIHLGQAILRADKMDYVIQKSVELGVTHITPLITERTGVKLSAERLESKLLHWQQIIISACEQCGRNSLPILYPVINFNDWVGSIRREGNSSLKLILNPKAEKRLIDFQQLLDKNILILIGPEGGFSQEEIQMAEQNSFIDLSLGPRILRAETAALAVISALQATWGDF